MRFVGLVVRRLVRREGPAPRISTWCVYAGVALAGLGGAGLGGLGAVWPQAPTWVSAAALGALVIGALCVLISW